MQYASIGNSGLKVSRLCLGTMTFGFKFRNIGAVGAYSGRFGHSYRFSSDMCSGKFRTLVSVSVGHLKYII